MTARSWTVAVVNFGSSSLLEEGLVDVGAACTGAAIAVVDNKSVG